MPATLFDGDRCDHCRFWRRTDDDAGECRRKAPPPLFAIFPTGCVAVIAWPPMPADGWCGEWQPKSLPQPTEQEVELARLRAEVARLSRAVVDGEGDEED